jgi:hypothetical protein
MGQNVLGQRGEDGLKVGTLGSGSHNDTIRNNKGEQAKSPNNR